MDVRAEAVNSRLEAQSAGMHDAQVRIEAMEKQWKTSRRLHKTCILALEEQVEKLRKSNTELEKRSQAMVRNLTQLVGHSAAHEANMATVKAMNREGPFFCCSLADDFVIGADRRDYRVFPDRRHRCTLGPQCFGVSRCRWYGEELPYSSRDYYYRGKMSADEDQWWMEWIKAIARDTAGEVLCEELSPKWRRDLRDFMNLFFSREDTQGRLGQARRDWDAVLRSKKQDWSAVLQEVQVIKKRLDSLPVWSHATEQLFKRAEQNFNHLFQEMETVKEQVGDISSRPMQIYDEQAQVRGKQELAEIKTQLEKLRSDVSAPEFSEEGGRSPWDYSLSVQVKHLERRGGFHLDLRNQVNQHENDLSRHSDLLEKISRALLTEKSSQLDSELQQLGEIKADLGNLLTESTARMDKMISKMCLDQMCWEEQFVKKLEKKVQVLEDRCDMRGAVQAQEREQMVARQQSDLAQEMVGIKERVFSLERRSTNSVAVGSGLAEKSSQSERPAYTQSTSDRLFVNHFQPLLDRQAKQDQLAKETLKTQDMVRERSTSDVGSLLKRVQGLEVNRLSDVNKFNLRLTELEFSARGSESDRLTGLTAQVEELGSAQSTSDERLKKIEQEFHRLEGQLYGQSTSTPTQEVTAQDSRSIPSKFAAEIQHCRRHIRSFMERELRQVMRCSEEHPTARQVAARQAELERELEEMEQRILDLEFFRQELEVDKDWASGQN